MQIRETLKAVGKAFTEFKKSFKFGMDTDQLFIHFKNSLTESLSDYQIVYDYVWGKDTLNIDGVTKGYIPKEGDTLIMDVSVGKNGVWCDVCRTFFVGNISREQREVFEMIKASIREGQKAIKKGALASEVYKAVNGVHERQGKTLVHHAGHKIGESCLMQPQFLLDNNTALQAGDFYTVESGAYQDFGVRLENDFLLTEDGAEDLFEEILPLNIEEYLLK